MRKNNSQFEEHEEIEEYFNLSETVNIVLTSVKIIVLVKENEKFAMKCISYEMIFSITNEENRLRLFIYKEPKKENNTIKERFVSKASFCVNFLCFNSETDSQKGMLSKVEKLLQDKIKKMN